jgi:cytochrome c oxidase assembly protein subunit 15
MRAMATKALRIASPADAAARPPAIAVWLIAVAVLVFAMVVVGGITRLTESGLSMVKWEPVSGIVPPIGDAAWSAEFAAYKASPQYAQVNAGMSLDAFKGIYFWEYVHRVLARMIGVAFALPLAWFAWKRAIPKGYGWRLTGILALGGLQGAIGWWMVASGLVDKPAVAHERLATHLVTALLIMSACIWTALDLTSLRVRAGRPTAWIVPFLALLSIQIVWGAFTAGLRAGHASDTWPLMFGQIVPPGLASLINDPVSVQFVHRSHAWLVAAAALAIALRLFRAGAGGRALALGAVVIAQFALGVATILSGVSIPIAVAHQAGAALLLATSIVAAHWCWRGRSA